MIIDLSKFRKAAIAALPPDPENMNDERAAWAETALLRFREDSGADDADALTDLLCDLMHWSDRNHGDFVSALSRARRRYDAETSPPPIEQPQVSPVEAAKEQPPYWMQRVQEFG